MQTKREALVTAGLAKPGRGKFSNEAKAWLAKQEAAGVTFSDTAITPTPKTEKPDVPVDYNALARNSQYYFPDEYRFPEAEYKAVSEDKKVWSLRECCNSCKVSLVNHSCNSPSILGDIKVSIVRR